MRSNINIGKAGTKPPFWVVAETHRRAADIGSHQGCRDHQKLQPKESALRAAVKAANAAKMIDAIGDKASTRCFLSPGHPSNHKMRKGGACYGSRPSCVSVWRKRD